MDIKYQDNEPCYIWVSLNNKPAVKVQITALQDTQEANELAKCIADCLAEGIGTYNKAQLKDETIN